MRWPGRRAQAIGYVIDQELDEMKRFLLLAFTAIGLSTTTLAADTSQALQGDAAAGKGKITLCTACHGADGNSPVAMYPKLAGQNVRYLVKQMQDIQADVRPVPEMTGMLTGMDTQDFADIAAFYASQATSIGQADPDLVALGESIYRGGILSKDVPACASCHSVTGVGNGPAGFPRLGGQHAEYTAAQLKDFRAAADGDPAGRSNDGDDTQTMRTISYRLSDREIQAVSTYIQGLY